MEPTLSELLVEGLKLMALGMISVFAFLLLLVGTLIGMSRLTSRMAPAPDLVRPAEPQGVSGPAGEAQPRRVAVIIAALRYHHGRHPRG